MNTFVKLLPVILLAVLGLLFHNSILAASDEIRASLFVSGDCDPHGDINLDGNINLVDFSILMYFWQQTNPSNPCADINIDGIVNITDFSIMLYWWTG